MVSAEKATIVVIAVLAVAVAFVVFQFLGDSQDVELDPIAGEESASTEQAPVTDILDPEGGSGGGDGLTRERVAPVIGDLEEGEEAGGVMGRVVNKNLAPLADARVALCKGEALFLTGAGAEVGVVDTTDAQGNFRLEGLVPGFEYSIVVTHKSYAEKVVNPIIARSGTMAEMADIIMEEGYIVFGRVSNEAGVAQAGILVELMLPGGSILGPKRKLLDKAETDGTGSFRFGNVSTRNFEVRASGEGFGSQTKRSTFFQAKKEMEVNFELGPAQAIMGRVVDTNGVPLEGVHLRASLTSRKKLFTTSAEAVSANGGAFEINGLTSGIYVIRATLQGYSPKAQQRILSGANDVEIKLHRQGGVSGVVRDQKTNDPVTAFTMYVYKVRRAGQGFIIGEPRFINSADGSFLLNDLDPDNYRLEVSSANFARGVSEKFRVEREDIKEGVNIFLTGGGYLTGKIVDEGGEPIKGVRVTLRFNQNPDDMLFFFEGSHTDPEAMGDSGTRAVSKSDGSFIKKHITPGTYQVHFKRKGFTERTINDITVFEGEDAATDMGEVELYRGGGVSGKTLAANGSVLPGAVVVLSSENGYRTRQMVSDKDGYFEFKNLPPGKYSATVHSNQIEEGENEFNIFDQLMVAERSKVEFFLNEGEDKNIVVQLLN